MIKHSIFTITLAAFACLTASAQNKSDEMDTDRPNLTETPVTVKKGHFQYEAGLLRRETKNSDLEKQKDWLFNLANLKFGLSEHTDIQVIVQSYGRESTTLKSSGETETRAGFGNITLRLKQNLQRNENSNFSIAVLPYVKFPTTAFSEQKKFEEGLIIPMKVSLPKEWELGVQLETDRLQNDEGEGMHTELLNSYNISHDLVKHLKAFAETCYTINLQEHQLNNFLDAALQLEVAKNIKIDGGLNYGIQKDAERSVFLGLSFRL